MWLDGAQQVHKDRSLGVKCTTAVGFLRTRTLGWLCPFTLIIYAKHSKGSQRQGVVL